MKKTVLFKAGLASFSALMMLAQPTFANDTIHFSNCTEAWENGYSDIHRGEPGYSSRLDKDGERSKAPRGVFKPRQSSPQNRVSSSRWVKQDGYWYYYSDNGNPVTNSWGVRIANSYDGSALLSVIIYNGGIYGKRWRACR